MPKLTKREYAIAQEAFMIGRVYNKGGETESPREINEILERKCLVMADSISPNDKPSEKLPVEESIYCAIGLIVEARIEMFMSMLELYTTNSDPRIKLEDGKSLLTKSLRDHIKGGE